ncbi:hypothetical protein PLESTB_000631100 [Pleodorina starrii]|uniref:N-acetyltransferase domain-containing protein n=1 Tax=Pleodorina starrii TaxID=330485 RepID=A0A9W6F1R7_9CHLO|nr:hypothetical protein PLESTB_000631100 [Pleodorina starrii]GLC69703.1 hypothetical protein PLESTF_000868200 [Pleodorina starrii]
MLRGLIPCGIEQHRLRRGVGASRSVPHACSSLNCPRPRPTPAATAAAATASSEPQDGRLRICLARRGEHFDAVARVWAEALLRPGLTELPAPAGEDELRRLTEGVAQRLRQSYDRKLRAAAASRSLWQRGEALLQQLRRGGLTVLETQLLTRQLEAIRRDLRRARRRRLWACLVAWREGAPGSGSAGSEGLSGCSVQQEQEQGPGRGQPSEQCEGPAHRPVPLPDRTSTTLRAAAARRCSSGDGGGGGGGTGGGVRVGCSSSSSGGSSGGGGSGCPGALAGYVLVSVSQPLALLPPPLPSRAPQQLHVDALAVCPGQRRRGVGSALLAAAERLAGRWGASSLWLHVDSSNDAAVQMYSDRGYGIARIQAPGPLAGLTAAAAAAWRPAPARVDLLWNQNPHQGPRGAPGEGLEGWRRRQRSRKFVMQKRLLPQRHGPPPPPPQQRHGPPQSQKRGEQWRRHLPPAQDRPKLTGVSGEACVSGEASTQVSGEASTTHGSSAPAAAAAEGSSLGSRPQRAAAAEDDGSLQSMPTSSSVSRALARAHQGRAEGTDNDPLTHGSVVPGESRPRSPSRRQAGVYEWQ